MMSSRKSRVMGLVACHTFTADGRSIVYSAEEQNGGDGGALWRLDASGTEPAVALTQPTMPGQDADAAISPDGSTVRPARFA